MATRQFELGSTPKFIPSHVRGDRDFDGNGPRIYINARLRIVNGNQLWVRIWMRAQETKSDWTTAEGSVNYLVFNGANEGVRRINRILSDPFSYTSYEDLNHRDDSRDLPAYELVDKFEVTGDTRGDEAGTRTGVIVHFNPVKIDYEPFPDADNLKTVDIDPTPKFVPQHVQGDKDFGGNGPNVIVTASISVENDTEIWARVWMRAIETKSDYTEARGSQRYLVYRNDKKIRQITSDTFSSTFFRDNDHQTDRVYLTGSELVRQFAVTGDTMGGEAGSRTGVVVYFNPVTFREEV